MNLTLLHICKEARSFGLVDPQLLPAFHDPVSHFRCTFENQRSPSRDLLKDCLEVHSNRVLESVAKSRTVVNDRNNFGTSNELLCIPRNVCFETKKWPLSNVSLGKEMFSRSLVRKKNERAILSFKLGH
jgi:hypothetical protein